MARTSQIPAITDKAANRPCVAGCEVRGWSMKTSKKSSAGVSEKTVVDRKRGISDGGSVAY